MIIATLPTKTCDIIMKGKKNPSLKEDSDFTISEGGRNDAVFKIACSLRRQQLPSKWVRKTIRYLNKNLVEPPLDDSEIKGILQSTLRYDHDAEDNFGCMSEVKSEKVDWFWYPYFPKGSITLIDGHPGRGKSYFTTYLAAILSTGGKLPFSEEIMPKGRTLIFSAEDDPAKTMRPRLEKMHANLVDGSIHYQRRYEAITKDKIVSLEAEIVRFRPDLLIIDPLLTYMGDQTDAHRFNEVTAFLSELDQIARDYNICVIGIRHLTKSQNDEVMARGLGSMGFAARARSIIHIGPDIEDEDLTAFVHVKSSYAKTGQTLLYELVGGGRDEVPELVWVSTASYGAKSLYKSADVGRPDLKDGIEPVIREVLATDSMPTQAIVRLLQARGFNVSKRTVNRVLADIAVPVGKGVNTKWELK